MLKQAVLAATVLASLSGGAKAQATNPYIGEIQTFAFPYCPYQWLPTNGQLLQIASYPILYDLLGKRFGGDGVKTFALPKTRGLTTYNNVPLTQCISTLGVYPSQG